ncbi:hypothetical protein [Thalassotalea maritima]|uniref:hypothetical protein n=1 Tax=Thalassotalea maritima TaxID=3242416 RepID=UPI003527600A
MDEFALADDAEDTIDRPWLEPTKQQLLTSIVANNLPHALLLHGSYAAGQRPLASWLAARLLCQRNIEQLQPCGQCKACHLWAAQSHPDLVVIDTGDKAISVNDIRIACQSLEKTAQLGHNKVVLINRAELLTTAAANALLKTLEEPTLKSYLLLVCNHIEQLLPTILSRCAKVAVTPPTGPELANVASNKQAVHAFSTVSELHELYDDNVFADKQQFVVDLQQFLQHFDNSNELAEQISLHQHGMRWLLSTFEAMYRYKAGWTQALASADLVSIIEHYTEQQLFDCWTVCVSANKQLKTLSQANKTFTVEALLVKIEQCLAQ